VGVPVSIGGVDWSVVGPASLGPMTMLPPLPPFPEPPVFCEPPTPPPPSVVDVVASCGFPPHEMTTDPTAQTAAQTCNRDTTRILLLID
jgi:hypothetical protein